MGFIIVAIDGEAASGKSSTARMVAEECKLLYVDSGSQYRALTHHCLNLGISPTEPEKLESELASLPLETEIRGYQSHLSLPRGVLEQSQLKSAAVNRMVSRFAALPGLRKILLSYQRRLPKVAREHRFNGIIMEGRDIGSVIFPEADYKFFLEANSDARTLRRIKEGLDDAIKARDHTDKTRQHSPLVCPPDAIRIDNTTISLKQVVNLICQQIRL